MAVELEELLEKLHHDRPSEAKYTISNIETNFNDGLDRSNLDYALSITFNNESGIIKFIETRLTNKDYKNPIAELFVLIKYLVHHFHDNISQYVLNIKKATMLCISTELAPAEEKEKAFDVLIEILECGPWGCDLDIPTLIKKVKHQIHSKPTPKVLQKDYHILGIISRRYPEHMTGSADTVLQMFINELTYQMNSSKHTSFPVITGCLNGLTEHIYTFALNVQDSTKHTKTIYGFVKRLADPGDSKFKVAQRAALLLIEKHGSQMAVYLYGDYKWWHQLLLKWLRFSNPEDRKAGMGALYTFYEQVAQILKENHEEEEMQVFQYFMHFFKEKLEMECCTSHELHLIIKGFGLFAGPCQQLMSEGEVSNMFTLIVQRTEQTYLQEGELNKTEIHHLIGYVESLGTIILQLKDVTSNQMAALQRITVLLIQNFSQIPESFHKGAMHALAVTLTNLAISGSTHLDTFLSNVVYQGLIRCCSHSLPIDAELQKEHLRGNDSNFVTYKNYLPLWGALLKVPTYYKMGIGTPLTIVNKVYDELIKSVVLLMKKMDLSLKKKSNSKVENQSGTGEDEEEIPVLDPESGLQANNPKDFKIFINLIDLSRDLLERSDHHMFAKWIKPLTMQVVFESSRSPLISGFYKLLTTVLQLCDKLQYFKNVGRSETQACFDLLSKYMHDVLTRLKQYKGDLQISCLDVVLAAPVPLIVPLLPRVVPVFEIIFQIGHTYLPLAQSGLATLERWNSVLPAEDMNPLLKQILPHFDQYLQSQGTQRDPGAEVDIKEPKYLYKRGQRNMTKKQLVVQPTKELLALQQRMLCFIGQLDSNTCLSLISGDQWDQCTVWDNSQHLNFSLPFADMKPKISLDKLVPRVVELALSSSNRQTRIVACELLHSIIMHMLGTNLQLEAAHPGHLSKMFHKLMGTLLQLSCDTDQIVYQLYNPLVVQLVHWYSSKIQLRSKHTAILIEALMDGITHPTNTAVRDFSAKCLHEFVVWSIKQLSPKELEHSPVNIKAVLKKIYSFCLHPCPTKRLGAALVLNSVYSVLREQEAILDQFWLELLYYFVLNLSLAEQGNDAMGIEQQVSLALNHIERGLQVKAHLFNRESARRRKPVGWSGVLLRDAVAWLFEQCSSAHTACRHKSMELVCRLAPLVPEYKSTKNFVASYSRNELLLICESHRLTQQPSLCKFKYDHLFEEALCWLEQLLTSLDCYIWLFSGGYVQSSLLLTSSTPGSSTPKIFEAIKHFVESIILDLDRDGLSPTRWEMERFNTRKCLVILRLWDFIRAIVQNSDSDLLQYISENVLNYLVNKLISCCIFQPSEIGFDMRNAEVTEKLPEVMQGLLKLLKQKINQSCFMNLYLLLGEMAGKNQVTMLRELQHTLKSDASTQKQEEYIQGLHILQKCNVLGELHMKPVLDGGKIMEVLFSSLCEQCNNMNLALILQPGAHAYAESLLKLAFLFEDQVKTLVRCVLDNRSLQNPATHSFVPQGKHFFITFKIAILEQFIAHPSKSVDLLLEDMSGEKGKTVLFILGEMLQHVVKDNQHRTRLASVFEWRIFSHWDTLSEWSTIKVDRVPQLLSLVSTIASIMPEPVGFLGHHSNVQNWVMQQFSSKDLSLFHKNNALDLLPCLTSQMEDTNPQLTSALKTLKDQHFPLLSTELPSGSIEHAGFVSALRKILLGMEGSGSRILLNSIIAMTAGDDQHICEDAIQRSFRGFIRRQKPEYQLKAINVTYNIFCTLDYGPLVRLGAVKRFTVALLRACGISVARQFYEHNVRSLITMLGEPLDRQGGFLAEQQLVSKIGAWNIFELLFSKFDQQELEHKDSTITKAAIPKETYTGKELITDLTRRSMGARKENLPLSLSDHCKLVELFRKYQCAAYNTLVAIVSNTKREGKFYAGLLFNDDRNKQQLLWEKLVDCSKAYHFGMDWDEIPDRRKHQVSIRKQASAERTGEFQAVSYIPTLTQHLFDSTLSEDVTRFDFTNCVVLSSSLQEVETMGQTGCEVEVDLEIDTINIHECMAIICGMVQHMVDQGISPLPEQDQQITLPLWMDSLKKSLQDEQNHGNVHLFILKLILNKEHVFQPYAKYWLYPIMKTIVDKCLGDGINYFLTDVLSMLLSWHSVALPDANEMERYCASQVFHFLVENVDHGRRDNFNHNLDVTKTLVEVWKPCLDMPQQLLLNKLAHGDVIEPRGCEGGIQVAGIVLANGLQPWTSLGKSNYLQSLLLKLNNNYKDIYQPCAEVIGMALKFIDPHKADTLLDEDRAFLDSVIYKLQDIKSKELDKFLLCLNGIHKHYDVIAESFVTVLLFYLPKVYGVFKTICLEMICSKLEVFKEGACCEVSHELVKVLSHRDVDNQEMSLRIIHKLMPKLQRKQLEELVPEVCKFVLNKSKACRIVVYQILMWVLDQCNSCDSDKLNASLASLAKTSLLEGLVDPELNETLFTYWCSNGRLPKETPERLLTILADLYSPLAERHFLGYSTCLLLEATSCTPDYDTKMFEPLSACKFEDYRVLVSWRAQHVAIAPMFAESLASQLNQAASLESDNFLRATQASLAFQPTLNWGASSTSSNTLNSSINSSLLFSMGSEMKSSYGRGFEYRSAKKMYSKPGIDTPSDDTAVGEGFSLLRRRILKDASKIRNQFIKREYYRKVQRREMQQDRAKRRDAEVSMFRKYRIGDFPDIEIANSAIIKPLQVLAMRDSVVARYLLVSLFAGVLSELGDHSADFIVRAEQSFNNILRETTACTPALIGTMLEIAFHNSRLMRLDPNHVAQAARTSGHLFLGSLVLEESLIQEGNMLDEPGPSKRAKGIGGSQNHWLRLAELYGNINEWDVVRGIFQNKLQSDESMQEALAAEASSSWKEAEELYEIVLKGQCSDLQKDYCYEAYYKCLANLSDWGKLNNTIKEQVDRDVSKMWQDSWSQEKLLPWLFSSEIQLILEGKSNVNQFLTSIKNCLGDKEKANYLHLHLSEELAVLFALSGDFKRSRHHATQNTSLFLEEWSQLNPLSHKLRTDALLNLQKTAEIDEYLAFADVTDTNKYKSLAKQLHSKWKNNLPSKLDSLLIWESRLMYRTGFANQIKMKLGSGMVVSAMEETIHEMELSFIDSALTQSNFYVARKYLGRTRDVLEGSNEFAMRLHWNLAFSKAKWLRGKLEMETGPKLKWTLDSWDQLDTLLSDTALEQNPVLHAPLQQHQSALVLTLLHELQNQSDGLTNVSPELVDRLSKRIHVLDHSYSSLIEGLQKYGLMCHKKDIELAESGLGSDNPQVKRKAEQEVADAYFQIAQYCRSQFDQQAECELSATQSLQIVTSLLRAMKFGSEDARQLFPCLLQLPGLATQLKQDFIIESASVPEWMFLGWVNQMLACLDTPVGLVVGDVLERLARSYPQALIYPFHLSKNDTKLCDDEAGLRAKQLIERLQDLLPRDNLMETFLKAFSYLGQPTIILKYHIDKLYKIASKVPLNVDELKNAYRIMMEEMFPPSVRSSSSPSIQGKAFLVVQGYKVKLEEILGVDCTIANHAISRATIESLHSLLTNIQVGNLESLSSMLKDYSPWLDSFHSEKLGSELEIPGQYTGDKRPLPQHHIKIVGFNKSVHVMPSLRMPLQITILGNDAREHPYLVKFGEDLRQDQRLQQLFGIVNKILSQDPACRQRQLSIATYQVVPLTSRLGIIEWVENTKSLQDFMYSVLNDDEKQKWNKIKIDYNIKLERDSRSKHLSKAIVYRNQVMNNSRDKTITSFREKVNTVPWDILRRSLLSISSTPEAYFSLRQNFASSLAVLSIVHWLLGIGDRHLGNCLVLQRDARCLGIDFGHAFGTATQFLTLPELVPFRLTPQIINLMQPMEDAGLLYETMVHCLKALRNNHQVLLATMEVFVQEPSVDWLEFARRQGNQDSNTVVGADEWFPKQKITLAKQKLQGANPFAITEAELRAGHANSPFLSTFVEVARGHPQHNIRATTQLYNLSPELQVKCLLDQATDHNILGRIWYGWQPWI